LGDQCAWPSAREGQQMESSFRGPSPTLSGCRFVDFIDNKGDGAGEEIQRDNRSRCLEKDNRGTNEEKKGRGPNSRKRRSVGVRVTPWRFTCQKRLRRARPALRVTSKGIGHNLPNLRAAATISEGLDMDENASAIAERRNEPVSFFVVPGRYFSFAPHTRFLRYPSTPSQPAALAQPPFSVPRAFRATTSGRVIQPYAILSTML